MNKMNKKKSDVISKREFQNFIEENPKNVQYFNFLNKDGLKAIESIK